MSIVTGNKPRYQLNYCEWTTNDGLIRGYCLRWQGLGMPGPGFYYLDESGEIPTPEDGFFGQRTLDCLLIQFDNAETWPEVKANLGNLSHLLDVMRPEM